MPTIGRAAMLPCAPVDRSEVELVDGEQWADPDADRHGYVGGALKAVNLTARRLVAISWPKACGRVGSATQSEWVLLPIIKADGIHVRLFSRPGVRWQRDSWKVVGAEAGHATRGLLSRDVAGTVVNHPVGLVGLDLSRAARGRTGACHLGHGQALVPRRP